MERKVYLREATAAGHAELMALAERIGNDTTISFVEALRQIAAAQKTVPHVVVGYVGPRGAIDHEGHALDAAVVELTQVPEADLPLYTIVPESQAEPWTPSDVLRDLVEEDDNPCDCGAPPGARCRNG